MTLTFEQFQATREVLTVEQYREKYMEHSFECGQYCTQIYRYKGGLIIEALSTGEYYLQLDFDGTFTARLYRLEKVLYEYGSRHSYFEAPKPEYHYNYLDYKVEHSSTAWVFRMKPVVYVKQCNYNFIREITFFHSNQKEASDNTVAIFTVKPR